jgi:hypothetical protein
MPGPYGIREQENAMEMVRHHDEGVQHNVREVIQNGIPANRCGLRYLVGYHLAAHNLTKQTLPMSGADGYEIRPRLGIVESRQAQLLPQSRCLQMIRSTARTLFLNNLGHDEA